MRIISHAFVPHTGDRHPECPGKDGRKQAMPIKPQLCTLLVRLSIEITVRTVVTLNRCKEVIRPRWRDGLIRLLRLIAGCRQIPVRNAWREPLCVSGQDGWKAHIDFTPSVL